MRNIKYIISDAYDATRNFLNPRQKWLTKIIPNSWCDKTELIPRILFACLVDFVENEEGLEYDQDWSEDVAKGYVTQEFADNRKKVYAEIREAYEYVKNVRPVLQKELEDAYPPYNDDWLKPDPNDVKMVGNIKIVGMLHKTTDEERNCYKNVDKIERKIESLDMKAMKTIIKHHGYLWT